MSIGHLNKRGMTGTTQALTCGNFVKTRRCSGQRNEHMNLRYEPGQHTLYLGIGHLFTITHCELMNTTSHRYGHSQYEPSMMEKRGEA